MADIEKVIKGLEKWIDDPLAQNAEIEPQLVHDALELLKEYRKHLQKDLETLKEEKRRLEFEHEAKAFIYKEKDGLMTIKISN